MQFASQMITSAELLKRGPGSGDVSALLSCPSSGARLPWAQAAVGKSSKRSAVGLASKWGVLSRSWSGNEAMKYCVLFLGSMCLRERGGVLYKKYIFLIDITS